jgi:hypothetical protein
MSKSGATVKDVPAQQFIAALAAHFKKSSKLELPAWHDLVKTGTFKELCPNDPDWYYVRAAAVARRVYLRGGTGVGEFSRVNKIKTILNSHIILRFFFIFFFSSLIISISSFYQSKFLSIQSLSNAEMHAHSIFFLSILSFFHLFILF